MSFIVGILTAFLFLAVLITGTWKFRKSLVKRPPYSYGENTDDLSAAWLVEHLEKATKSVKIVSGNLNPRVFDQIAEPIVKRLRDTPTLNVKILTGSEILTLRGGNRLFTLTTSEDFVKEFDGRFQLAFLSQRPVTHYRVVDLSHLYVEEPHRVGASRRIVETLENSIFKGWQYDRHFDMLWKGGARGEPRLVPLEQDKEAEGVLG